MTRLGLLLLLPLAVAAQAPPGELWAGAQQRLVYDPPLVTDSGGFRLVLVECDRLEVAGERFCRFLAKVTALGRDRLPAELVMLGEPFAVTAAGDELTTAALSSGLRSGDAWWVAFTFPAPPGDLLPVLAGTIGPRPEVAERRLAVSVEPLGEVSVATEPRLAAQVTVLRRETTRLPVETVTAPLESILESTRPTAAEPPAATEERPFLTLRLYTLGAEPGDGDWRPADMRLIGDGGEVAQWRYVRRLWRPDWGGWLGATGRDDSVDGRPAILIEEVAPSSPAEQAGIEVGDRLLALDGAPVGPAFALGEQVRRRPPDSPIRLLVRRGEQNRELALTLRRRALWPDRDPLELEQAFAQLGAALGPGGNPVLTQWDWQSWAPPPADFVPRRLELILTRTATVRGTTFLFRNVPLQP